MTTVRQMRRDRMVLSEKVQGRHQDRLAIVYVRQSTLRQVEQHQESTRLQYALVERALQLGWARERIEVIDDDLGRSGASAVDRPGFQRLVAELGWVALGWCWVWRCRGWPAPAGTGISCLRSARSLTRSSRMSMASKSTQGDTPNRLSRDQPEEVTVTDPAHPLFRR